MSKIIFFGLISLILSQSFAQVKTKKNEFADLELFNKVLYLIESQYYRPVDRKKLIEGALKGMMDTLDPHSTFLNKEFFKKMQNDTAGEFGGLGIEITQKDGVVYIVTPIEDSPAFKAGIQPRDKIMEIDHDSIVGMSLDEVIDKMKGEKGKKIHLGIMREEEKELRNFYIKRETIKVKSVKSALIKEHFAWLRLTQFQKNSTKHLVAAIKKLEKKTRIDGIILDLRSNPGGLLNQAVDIASIFLQDGVVVSTESRDPKKKEVRYVKKGGLKRLSVPLVVLINGASASASEIVAGALQDHNRALVLGTQSFGKGSVQSVARVDKENGIKLTIAQYMTAKGRKIQAIGIKPDIEIPRYDSKWIKENRNKEEYIREKDLKNHLTATIETKKEKQRRLRLEKEKRIAREKQRKKVKKNKIFKQYSPADDYQILEAVKYLKTYKLIKK